MPTIYTHVHRICLSGNPRNCGHPLTCEAHDFFSYKPRMADIRCKRRIGHRITALSADNKLITKIVKNGRKYLLLKAKPWYRGNE